MVSLGCLNASDNAHPLNDSSKDNMLSVEVGGGNGGNEKLRSIGVWARVGHAQDAW